VIYERALPRAIVGVATPFGMTVIGNSRPFYPQPSRSALTIPTNADIS
jgi:hypothetical protein